MYFIYLNLFYLYFNVYHLLNWKLNIYFCHQTSTPPPCLAKLLSFFFVKGGLQKFRNSGGTFNYQATTKIQGGGVETPIRAMDNWQGLVNTTRLGPR